MFESSSSSSASVAGIRTSTLEGDAFREVVLILLALVHGPDFVKEGALAYLKSRPLHPRDPMFFVSSMENDPGTIVQGIRLSSPGEA